MTEDTSRYNIGKIRELLLAAFTAEDLRRFCLDRPVFRPIIDRFGPGHGLDDMVDEILDYCRPRLLWKELLAEVAEVNPLQYARFEPELCVHTSALARQLREWFHAIGYSVERDVQRNGIYTELVVDVPRRRRGYDRVLVRALDGEIRISHIDDLRQSVDDQRLDEGWLVCERRVSTAARSKAETQDDLFVYTFDELIDEDVSWDHYFDWLENEVKAKGVDRYYVHLSGRIDELGPDEEILGSSYYGNLDNYIDLWLEDPTKEHISILGEFGTGKTWFTLHYAHRMKRKYEQAKAEGLKRPRVPLIIQLRNYGRGFKDVGALLSEFVFREHEIGLPGYRAFEQLNRMGRLLLIFDGFDEMAVRVDRQKMVNNFWELAKVVLPGSKAILTCRTEHFHYAQQERALLYGELRASTSTIVLETPKFEVLHLEMFNEAQIRQVLSCRTDEATVELVMGNQSLVDIARRPVLIDFTVEALPEVREGKPASMAHIFYYAMRRKMERDIEQKRTFTSLADKLYFLCELSWEMLSTNQMSLHYKLFPQRIQRYFGPKVAEVEEDHWHYDLLGQTMLVRDENGNYTPAHRSLLEFFAAYKFAAEMGALLPEFTEASRSQSYIASDAPPQDYTWSGYYQRIMGREGRIQPMAPLRGFALESMQHLMTTVGRRRLTSTLVSFLKDMVVAECLWLVLAATRGCKPEEVGYAGGNAATLLHIRGASFRDAKLADTVLAGANLFGANLDGADLARASLRSAIMSNCSMRNANLSEANMERATFDSANLAGATLTSALCSRTDFRSADLRQATFENARCSSYFARADVQGANFKGAWLAGSVWSSGRDMSRHSDAVKIARHRGANV